MVSLAWVNASETVLSFTIFMNYETQTLSYLIPIATSEVETMLRVAHRATTASSNLRPHTDNIPDIERQGIDVH